MVEEIARFVPYIVLGGLLLALVLFVVSLQLLRRGRTGPYWRLRRAAGQRGGQLFLLAVALFVGSLALAFFSGFAAIAIGRLDVFFNQRDPDALYGIAPTALTAAAIAADQTETAAATESLTLSGAAPAATRSQLPTTAPTPTPTPTVTATLLPTLPPTITPTPTITFTPSPTFETALKLGIPFGAREAGEEAVVRVAAADTAVAGNGTPVEPREIFEAGLRRIYLFASFEGMQDGVAWTRLLYRDGVPVQGSTLLWAMGEAGSTYFFFGDEVGYPPGEYRVELWLGNRVVNSFDFAIINPAGS